MAPLAHLVDAFPPTDVLEAVILSGRSFLVVALAGDEVFDHLIARRRTPRPAPDCCKHFCAAVLSVCLSSTRATAQSIPATKRPMRIAIRQRTLCDTVTGVSGAELWNYIGR